MEAILRNQNSVLTVSTLLEGEYGVKGVCLSVSCIVNQQGVTKIVEGKLGGGELVSLSRSTAVLRKSIEGLREK